MYSNVNVSKNSECADSVARSCGIERSYELPTTHYELKS